MRYAALLIVLASACVPAPFEAVGPVPAGSDALDCAANKATALGYVIRERNENSVIASKTRASVEVRMTASVFTDASGRHLRVETVSYSGGQPWTERASGSVQEATAVRTECAP
jgi:hypothetical protein